MGTTPDFLVIGHVTRDLLADGTYRLGGTALYAAVTAARLGCRVAVYSAGGPELDLAPLYQAAPEAHVVCRPAPGSTTFANRYTGGHRQQILLDRAGPLLPDDLPPAWRAAPVVLLGPVAQEVPPTWAECFRHAVLGACLQGWLRTWDGAGQVRFAPWEEALHWLPRFRAAFLSVEDLGERQDLAVAYAAHCPLVLLTAGPQGATLYQQGRPEPVAPFPAQEVDSTGAGDVFATAFLVRYAEGSPLAAAARFAAAAAALSVQGPGITAIPDRGAVESLL
jgi:sugar/nucleoside kinase (ribokinase family)